jgi:hypothetical protein
MLMVGFRQKTRSASCWRRRGAAAVRLILACLIASPISLADEALAPVIEIIAHEDEPSRTVSRPGVVRAASPMTQGSSPRELAPELRLRYAPKTWSEMGTDSVNYRDNHSGSSNGVSEAATGWNFFRKIVRPPTFMWPDSAGRHRRLPQGFAAKSNRTRPALGAPRPAVRLRRAGVDSVELDVIASRPFPTPATRPVAEKNFTGVTAGRFAKKESVSPQPVATSPVQQEPRPEENQESSTGDSVAEQPAPAGSDRFVVTDVESDSTEAQFLTASPAAVQFTPLFTNLQTTDADEAVRDDAEPSDVGQHSAFSPTSSEPRPADPLGHSLELGPPSPPVSSYIFVEPRIKPARTSISQLTPIQEPPILRELPSSTSDSGPVELSLLRDSVSQTDPSSIVESGSEPEQIEQAAPANNHPVASGPQPETSIPTTRSQPHRYGRGANRLARRHRGLTEIDGLQPDGLARFLGTFAGQTPAVQTPPAAQERALSKIRVDERVPRTSHRILSKSQLVTRPRVEIGSAASNIDTDYKRPTGWRRNQTDRKNDAVIALAPQLALFEVTQAVRTEDELGEPGILDDSPTATNDHSKSIFQIEANIQTEGELRPTNVAERRFALAGRVVHPMGYSRTGIEATVLWEAPSTVHRPLLFEEVNLERYGYSAGLFQPVLSAAHFFGRVPALPYLMAADGGQICHYTLGHYRPGSCAPYQVYLPPRDLKGLAAEATAVLGMLYLIP